MNTEQYTTSEEFTSTFHQPSKKEIAESLPEVASGAHWFWWIAALSVINSVMAYTGSSTNFVAGLGLTQFVDGYFGSTQVMAIALNALIIIFFVAMGWFAAKGHMAAFGVGTLVYFVDGALFMYHNLWMPVLFHALALYYILRAAHILHQAIQNISHDV